MSGRCQLLHTTWTTTDARLNQCRHPLWRLQSQEPTASPMGGHDQAPSQAHCSLSLNVEFTTGRFLGCLPPGSGFRLPQAELLGSFPRWHGVGAGFRVRLLFGSPSCFWFDIVLLERRTGAFSAVVLCTFLLRLEWKQIVNSHHTRQHGNSALSLHRREQHTRYRHATRVRFM